MSGKAVSQIPLPKGWLTSVQSAVLQVIALAQFAMTHVRGWAADSVNTRVRLKAELNQVNQDNALPREEMHIKDARTAQIDPDLGGTTHPSAANISSRQWSPGTPSRPEPSSQNLSIPVPPRRNLPARIRGLPVGADAANRSTICGMSHTCV
jgi:hypothetical protein